MFSPNLNDKSLQQIVKIQLHWNFIKHAILLKKDKNYNY